jgi:hypothetical protein
MAQQTGRITIKVDGDSLQSKEGASLQVGGIQREPVMSDQGGIFHKEKFEPSMIQATLIHTTQTDLDTLRALTSATINFEGDDGVVYVVRGAFFTSAGELSNGEISVSFAGQPAERV